MDQSLNFGSFFCLFSPSRVVPDVDVDAVVLGVDLLSELEIDG